MNVDEIKDFEVYPIFGFMFRQPYNKLSSNAKVVFAIRQNDRKLTSMHENLGVDKKYYSSPKPRSFDEIMDMTGLTSQQVHNAHAELEKAGLYKEVDCYDIET